MKKLLMMSLFLLSGLTVSAGLGDFLKGFKGPGLVAGSSIITNKGGLELMIRNSDGTGDVARIKKGASAHIIPGNYMITFIAPKGMAIRIKPVDISLKPNTNYQFDGSQLTEKK